MKNISKIISTFFLIFSILLLCYVFYRSEIYSSGTKHDEYLRYYIISFILFLNVSRDVIEKRIMGRLTCEKCNKTFNEYFNKVEIDLHECGKNHLKKRKDDNKETIIRRYDTYMKKTKPVLDFYSSKSYFHEIDGSQKIEVITGKIDQIINV